MLNRKIFLLASIVGVFSVLILSFFVSPAVSGKVEKVDVHENYIKISVDNSTILIFGKKNISLEVGECVSVFGEKNFDGEIYADKIIKC
jgi:hypothetical protein